MDAQPSTLVHLLDHLDHGSIAQLVGDAKLIELISAVDRARPAPGMRGKHILSVMGGPIALLENASSRHALILALSKPERDALASALNVPVLSPFKLTAERRAKLLAYFQVPDVPATALAPTKPAVEIIPVPYDLFHHQYVAMVQCLQYLESSNPRVMLHMPTGSGKTTTAMHIVCRFLNRYPGTVVVWIVAGVELCEQAAEDFVEAWTGLGERYLPLVRLWGSKRDVDEASFTAAEKKGYTFDPQDFSGTVWKPDLHEGMIIASVNTADALLQADGPRDTEIRAARTSLIVFDEAHRAVAPTYKQTIALLSNRKTGLLGLSATPGRHHQGGDASDDAELVALFGGNKVVLAMPGYASPVHGLIEKGYLARLTMERLEIARDDLTEAEIRGIQQQLRKSLDLSEDQLKTFGVKPMRLLQVVERAERLVLEDEHLRVLIFAPSVPASDIMANLLQARGIRAHSVSMRTPDHLRQDYITQFKDTEDIKPMVLCNYNVLSTGFDAPRTSAVIIARPTISIVLLNQMAGRALRGPMVGGNATATLVTVVDTAIPELVETVKQFHAFDASWSNEEQSHG